MFFRVREVCAGDSNRCFWGVALFAEALPTDMFCLSSEIIATRSFCRVFPELPALQPRRSIFLGIHSLLAGTHSLPAIALTCVSGGFGFCAFGRLPFFFGFQPSDPVFQVSSLPFPDRRSIRLSRILSPFPYRINGCSCMYVQYLLLLLSLSSYRLLLDKACLTHAPDTAPRFG